MWKMLSLHKAFVRYVVAAAAVIGVTSRVVGTAAIRGKGGDKKQKSSGIGHWDLFKRGIQFQLMKRIEITCSRNVRFIFLPPNRSLLVHPFSCVTRTVFWYDIVLFLGVKLIVVFLVGKVSYTF